MVTKKYSSIYFQHPNSPRQNYLFLDLYYRYYDLIKLRSNIYQKLSALYEYGEINNPVLIGNLECDLQVLEKEEEELYNSQRSFDEIKKEKKKIEKKRIEIFEKLEQHGINAWRGHKIEPKKNDEEEYEITRYKVQLRYIIYKINKTKEEIRDLQKTPKLKDPFNYLKNKYGLINKEIELLIFLYYHNFEHAEPIRGDILLLTIFGKQVYMFYGQQLLFSDPGKSIFDGEFGKDIPDPTCLIENNLIERIDKGYDALSSTYAISNYANLIISGLHKELPHVEFKLKLVEDKSKDCKIDN